MADSNASETVEKEVPASDNATAAETENKQATAAAGVASPEMKNVQDLTRYVELLLQQMQERFQGISDQVLSRNILFKSQ